MSLKSQCIYFNLATREIQESTVESIAPNLKNENACYWVHLSSFELQQISKISGSLNLPPEVLHQFGDLESLPDILETEDSLTLTIHYWGTSAKKLVLHLTSRYCLTITDEKIPALERFADNYRREFRFAQTPGFILFLILNYLVDDYMKMRRHLEEASETVDEAIQSSFSENLNLKILDLKRQVITSKQFVSHLRDTLMQISGRRIPVISESCRQSLGEAYQHALNLTSQLESLRELVHNSLEAYNTAIAQKTNDLMKILTIFSAVLLPMSLIAAIYGMNFAIPEIHWRHGYAYVLGLMAFCGITLLAFFKKKRWF